MTPKEEDVFARGMLLAVARAMSCDAERSIAIAARALHDTPEYRDTVMRMMDGFRFNIEVLTKILEKELRPERRGKPS